jgi:hypothetical protein
LFCCNGKAVSMSVKLAAVVLAALSFATVAQAQDVIIEGDAPVVEQAPPDETVILHEPAPAPRVYGWTMRPADCGTFRYWNGERCADARSEPPVPE